MSSEIPRDRYGRLALSSDERTAVNRFIFDVLLLQGPPPLNLYGMRGLTREQQSESYESWVRGGRGAWGALHQGGTGQMAAICWYQHVHRPGSREWRPSIIIRALVAAALAASPDKPDESQPSTADSTPLANPHVGSPGTRGEWRQ